MAEENPKATAFKGPCKIHYSLSNFTREPSIFTGLVWFCVCISLLKYQLDLFQGSGLSELKVSLVVSNSTQQTPFEKISALELLVKHSDGEPTILAL